MMFSNLKSVERELIPKDKDVICSKVFQEDR